MDLHSLLPDDLVAVPGNGILICVVAVASRAGYSLVVVHGLLTVEHGLQVYGLYATARESLWAATKPQCSQGTIDKH